MSLALGIAGSLIGVIVGAFLTRWIDFNYERRAEIRQAIASALILRQELLDAKVGIEIVVEECAPTPHFLYAGLDAWDTHRENLLGVGMTHLSWVKLAIVFRHLLEIQPLLTGEIQPGLDESDIDHLTKVKDLCAESRELLTPYVLEDRIPLFRPDRVFKDSGRKATAP